VPITALLYPGIDDHGLAVSINGMAFLVAALAGQVTLSRGYRRLIAANPRHRTGRAAWLGIYVFVAVQAAWVLRPFVGDPALPPAFGGASPGAMPTSKSSACCGASSRIEPTRGNGLSAPPGRGLSLPFSLLRGRGDVLLLDVRMPRRGGLEVLETLKGAASAPPVLMLTTFDEPELLLDAVRRGAHGFLSKDVSLGELRAALTAVARGDTWFQPALTHALRRGVAERPKLEDTGPPDALTDREVEVLRLMAGGLTNREIAATLATAEGTVKNQVSSILSKLGVRDRTLAVLKAIESGRI
jgi:DNA-binding NarL/FixJ family response regulator